MIQVRHLHKSFDRVTAVRDVSFDAPDGTITGLLGRNGAGKTTTLRMLAGLLHPGGGTVRIDGINPADDGQVVRQQVGALLDHQGLYARLSAREHLAYFGRLRGLTRAALSARVDEALDTLGLDAIADRRVAGFSQGERLKVSLGCAMIHRPRHLLLDEATNGLDVPTVRSFKQLLKRLRDNGTCILFSSHVLGDIQDLCDRLVVVSEGSVAAEGTPGEIRERSGRATLEDAFVSLTGVMEATPC
jgi:sodium transport system ATP-binding protein